MNSMAAIDNPKRAERLRSDAYKGVPKLSLSSASLMPKHAAKRLLSELAIAGAWSS